VDLILGKQVVKSYNLLRTLGILAEDACRVLPNAATTNLVLTVNLWGI